MKMARKKIFVGKLVIYDGGNKREVFKINVMSRAYFPSYLYIKYTFVIGPFKTIRAAKLCVDDDDCSSLSTVKEYERRIIIYDTQSELIESYKKHLDK